MRSLGSGVSDNLLGGGREREERREREIEKKSERKRAERECE